MRCQDIKNRLELYIDNELGNQEKTEFERHLLKCPDCAKGLEVLKSINSIGKMQTFSEPEPDYWNQLSQNILQQLGFHREKTSWIADNLERLKRIILPEKISYRLIGLAATAVIVFFIVHIAFFRYGKFEAPIEIGLEDTVQITEPQSIATAPQKEVTSEKEIPQERRLQKIAKSTQENGAALPKIVDAESELTITEPKMRAKDKKLTISDSQIEMVAAEDIPPQKPPVPVFDQAAQAERSERFDEIKMKRSSVQAKKTEEIPFSMTAVSNRSIHHETDTSLNQFKKTYQQIKTIQDLKKKIYAWEKYLQTQPGIEFVRKAKFELALLYYKLAAENPSQENIYEAIMFYSVNTQFLFSTPDSVKFRKQYMQLQDFLKKMKKNE
jgi:hypothetical protein